MSIEGVIREEASQIAASAKNSALHFEREYAEIHAKAEEIKAKRDLARGAPERLLYFQVKVGGDYQCPACWIDRNSRSALVPKPGSPKEDIFECIGCGHVVSITY